MQSISSRKGDRLSSLQDDLLLHILALTKPYKSAVRSSSVAKRFLNLYTLVPCIHLNPQDFKIDIYVSYESATEEEEEIAYRGFFSFRETMLSGRIVEDALAKHKADLELLHIKILHPNPTTNMLMQAQTMGQMVNGWHKLMPPLNIRHLYLEYIVFSDVLFSCTSLISLYMDHVSFGVDSLCGVKGFPCLETLTLKHYKGKDYYGPRWLECSISTSPKLSRVHLEGCNLTYMNMVSSASLLFLRLHNNDFRCLYATRRDISLVCPNLKELSLTYLNLEVRDDMRGLFVPLWEPLSKLPRLCNLRLKLPKMTSNVRLRLSRQCLLPFDGVMISGLENVGLEIYKLGVAEKFLISQLLRRCSALTALFVIVESSFSYTNFQKFLKKAATYEWASQKAAIYINHQKMKFPTITC